MLSQDYRIVQDKQTQYLIRPRWRWRTLSDCTEFQSQNVPTWPKSWANIEDPVTVPLERNLYGNPLASLLWERQFEEALRELGWETVPNWEIMFVHRKQRLCLSICVDDIKMAGKKQNMAPTWQKLMKNVDIDEPTSFLDHVYLGCTPRECKPNETIIE